MRKFNYKIEMEGYDDTYIRIFTTTSLQKRHVVEMFENIKEKGRVKYKIKTKKL